MPRNYGRIATSIWRDEDFCSLSAPARFTYLMLISQPNITAAGVLSITRRRWRNALGFTGDALDKALGELQERSYIVADDDTEELLIRSFIRWDGGASNDKRRHAIREAASAVASRSIAASLAREIGRAGIPIPDALVDNQAGDRASIGHREATDTRRVVVTEGELGPQPTTHNPDPQPGREDPSTPTGIDPPPKCDRHPDGPDHDEPCRSCARVREWDDHQAERQRHEAAHIRRQCPDCDENGWQLDPTTSQPVRRCDHRVKASTR